MGRKYFVGFNNDSPSYRVYNREAKSVYLSREVRFDEKDSITGHRVREEHDGKRHTGGLFFTSILTPDVIQSRARSEIDNKT